MSIVNAQRLAKRCASLVAFVTLCHGGIFLKIYVLVRCGGRQEAARRLQKEHLIKPRRSQRARAHRR